MPPAKTVKSDVSLGLEGTSYPSCGIEVCEWEEEKRDDCLTGGGTKAVARPAKIAGTRFTRREPPDQAGIVGTALVPFRLYRPISVMRAPSRIFGTGRANALQYRSGIHSCI
jgi:hypothetical protein